MADHRRERVYLHFEDAVYRMFEVGYDAESLGEEVEQLVQDWLNDYGVEPPARAEGAR